MTNDYHRIRRRVLALVASLLLPATAVAQLARIELHTIHTQSPTDREFLTGSKDAKAAAISAELRLPRPGTDRLPAIVLLHGAGGVTGAVDEWAREFNAMGVATLIVDSLTGRGFTNLSDDQDRLSRLAIVVDAYRALDLLAKHPRIDPTRVMVLGWSRGGGPAYWTAMRRFRAMHGPAGGVSFAGHVALYPPCNRDFIEGLQLEGRPVRMFHGSADDYAPVRSCQVLVERLRQAGNDITLTEYAGAHHVFDAPALKVPTKLPRAQTTRNCPRLSETPDGTLVNSVTGKAFTYASDPCVERGTTVAYDAAAHAAALKAIKEFVAGTLKP